MTVPTVHLASRGKSPGSSQEPGDAPGSYGEMAPKLIDARNARASLHWGALFTSERPKRRIDMNASGRLPDELDDLAAVSSQKTSRAKLRDALRGSYPHQNSQIAI